MPSDVDVDELTAIGNTEEDLRRVGRLLGWFGGGGAGVLVICALSQASGSEQLQHAAGALLLGGASTVVGAFVGFLFGIPRAFQTAASTPGAGGYSPNTNLEQISDWLTKMLVGVGLTQLGKAPGLLHSVSVSISDELRGGVPWPLVSGCLVYFALYGFFLGYLLTRLWLGGAFLRADQNSIRSRVDEALESRQDGKVPDLKARQAAETVAKVPFARLRNDDERALWGRAQMAAGGLQEAVRNIRRIADQNPSLAEDFMLQTLYYPPPDGFNAAIGIGESMTAETPNRYGYLASALGQMYAWRQEQHASKDELQSIRKKALDAARRAVELSPAWKETIAELLDPSIPGADKNDDDLDVFKKDPEFRALAGLGAATD